jgi:hypothetical protein
VNINPRPSFIYSGGTNPNDRLSTLLQEREEVTVGLQEARLAPMGCSKTPD